VNQTQAFIRIAPLIFVAIWSTGFIAAKYSMSNADPFVFLCLRFTITACLLLVALFLWRLPLPVNFWRHRHDLIAGAFIHAGYLGFLFWPIQNGVPSGIVAIIVGIQPILTMALASLYIGESLNRQKMFGLIMGFIGVSVVLIGKYGINLGLNGGLDSTELVKCLISLLSFSVGVFYQKKFCDQSNLITGTSLQFISAALVCAVFAFLFDEQWTIHWTTTFVIALSWQVLALSIGAIVLLMQILKLGEAGRISSMFYLVPPLVVIEAWYLFNETLTLLSVLGMFICIAGVYFVNRTVKTVG
jgi:drug/metabolite transporter (DMT)-like permease